MLVNAAEKITGVSPSPLLDSYNTSLAYKDISIASDPTHPLHAFFRPLPSGKKRYLSLRASSTRLANSFIHYTVRMLNSHLQITQSVTTIHPKYCKIIKALITLLHPPNIICSLLIL